MNRALNLLVRGSTAIIIGFIFLAGLALTFPGATPLVQTHLRALFSAKQDRLAGPAQP